MRLIWRKVLRLALWTCRHVHEWSATLAYVLGLGVYYLAIELISAAVTAPSEIEEIEQGIAAGIGLLLICGAVAGVSWWLIEQIRRQLWEAHSQSVVWQTPATHRRRMEAPHECPLEFESVPVSLARGH